MNRLYMGGQGCEKKQHIKLFHKKARVPKIGRFFIISLFLGLAIFKGEHILSYMPPF